MKTPYTPGPLRVEVSPKFPHQIETFDDAGTLLFSRYLPAFCSNDRSREETISCTNFHPDQRSEFASANRRAIADEVVRAAAPDLVDALAAALDRLEIAMPALRAAGFNTAGDEVVIHVGRSLIARAVSADATHAAKEPA